MKKSGVYTGETRKRISGSANPVALALKNGQFKQRIVKSKVVYNRKLDRKKRIFPVDLHF